MAGDVSSALCQKCGLCCNGVIFADLQLEKADDSERLRALGLAFKAKGNNPNSKVRQPCAAFDGCRCQIYAERPQYCRQFECLLLKRVRTGQTDADSALVRVREARMLAKRVDATLRKLGEADGGTALNLRFRRVRRRLERQAHDSRTASLFADLTIAVHDLDLMLAEWFYPGT